MQIGDPVTYWQRGFARPRAARVVRPVVKRPARWNFHACQIRTEDGRTRIVSVISVDRLEEAES